MPNIYIYIYIFVYILYMYIYIYIYTYMYINKYNIATPTKTLSTKLVFPAGGLAPARTLITNFVLSLLSGLNICFI